MSDAPTVSKAVVAAFPVEGAAPLDVLAGLPLVLRAVLVAQKGGAQWIAVATSEDARAEVERVCADPRVRASLQLVTADSAAEAERKAIALAGAEYVLSRHHVVAGVNVRDASGRREAFRLLFEACRKPVDGLVSRHLNRHVSIFVSKRIVDTSITPNAISVVNFLLGVIAAGCAAMGGYAPMLVGAVLFQCNSILDGVDGELARVRFQGSKLGEWLDTISDDACNVMFYIGVGFGARAMGLAPLDWFGFAAAGLGVFTSVLYYAELVHLGAGDFYALQVQPVAQGFIGSVVGLFRLLLKKDFFILLFTVMALFGVLPWAAAVAVVGTGLTAVNAIARTVRWLGARRPEAA